MLQRGCQCMHHLRPSSTLLQVGSGASSIVRSYSSENPKWTPKAEEQFHDLFKLKTKPTKPPQQPREAVGTSTEPATSTENAIKATPPSTPTSPIFSSSSNPLAQRKTNAALPTLPTLPSLTPLTPESSEPRRPMRLQPLTSLPPAARAFNLPRPTRFNADPVPQIPSTGEFYAKIRRDEQRPTRKFEELEEEERAPELSDEKDSVIKLWVEGLPITDREVIQDALKLLGDKPIEVSEPEVVSERGMIATKSAFFTVNFGENNREKIFYQLENFGLTIKGMRCPVRTAEVKRSLVLIELGQIDEPTLVRALKEHDIPYATYDYPNRYNSPQRQIAFPYRGSVVLTFRSHAEAYETKRMFESAEGVVVGSDRLTAIWGARAGSAPLQVRTSTNYMKNLIWENRDLRKYVTAVRQRNAQLDEPAEFNDLTKSLQSNEQRDIERKRMYEDLASKLEEVKLAVAQARGDNAGENTEGIVRAEEIMDEVKEFESELHMDGVMNMMHQKSVLDETAKTRTLSPHVAKMDSADALNKLKEMQDTRIKALKDKHHQELNKLKEQFKTQEKLIVREVNSKNHRNASTTAEELGISKMSVQRLTRLKPRKKKLRVRAKKTEESSESSENADGENAETTENSESSENIEVVSESAEGEGKGEEVRMTERQEIEEDEHRDEKEETEREPSGGRQQVEDKSNERKDNNI